MLNSLWRNHFHSCANNIASRFCSLLTALIKTSSCFFSGVSLPGRWSSLPTIIHLLSACWTSLQQGPRPPPRICLMEFREKHGPSMWNKSRECRLVLQCAKGLIFDMSEFMLWFNKLYGIIKIHCQNGTCQNKMRDCEIDSECNLYKWKRGCNDSLREFMSSFKSVQKKWSVHDKTPPSTAHRTKHMSSSSQYLHKEHNDIL